MLFRSWSALSCHTPRSCVNGSRHMGIKTVEAILLLLVAATALFFILPLAGIPRAARKVSRSKRSVLSVILASAGVAAGAFGILGVVLAPSVWFSLQTEREHQTLSVSPGTWVLYLAMAALNGCWLAATLRANTRAARATAGTPRGA